MAFVDDLILLFSSDIGMNKLLEQVEEFGESGTEYQCSKMLISEGGNAEEE